MDELAIIEHDSAMPWPPCNAQYQKVKGFRLGYPSPAMLKSRLYRLRHAIAVAGGYVGVGIVRQRDASLGHEDGAHETPAIPAVGASSLVFVRFSDPIGNQRNKPAELVGKNCWPGTC